MSFHPPNRDWDRQDTYRRQEANDGKGYNPVRLMRVASQDEVWDVVKSRQQP